MFLEIGNWRLKIINSFLKILKRYSVPRWMIFLHDSVAVFLFFIFAYILRFNFQIYDFNALLAFQQALIALFVYAVYEVIFRPYSGMIRHTTIIDIFYVLLTTTLSLTILIALSLVSRVPGWTLTAIPISILIIHYVSINVYLFAFRIAIKTIYHLITRSVILKKKRVLIYGAGSMGVIVKRVLLSDIKGEYHVAGFIDNNKNLQGKKLNGIHVYAPRTITKYFLKKNRIETMVFAIKDIIPSEKSDLIKWGIDLGLEVRDTPAVESWLNGELQLRQIEKVKLEDLLGRDPIELNIKRIGLGLRGKTILVTGAAGSIGSEIVRQLILYPMKNLILVDQAETPMFNIINEVKSSCMVGPFHAILTDIAQEEKMNQIFKEYRPDIVFHAAAYKHVPLLEDNPHEALRVNVGGTRLITKLSMQYKVKKFVMVSSDKAVNPTNIMGASKRLCEMIVQVNSQKLGNKTQFIITRFGNVLGSNGSVIPVFKRQIEEGGPITVTHPEIVRYFMTIPEACQLVLEAGFMGKGNEIYVFDMGKPVKIVDLARQMIRLSGFVPDTDIRISFTGLRPGEKLYEELLANNESTLKTHHPKIRIAKVANVEHKKMLEQIDTIVAKIYSLTKQEVVETLKSLVPEFISNNEIYAVDPEVVKMALKAQKEEDEGAVKLTFHTLQSFMGIKQKK